MPPRKDQDKADEQVERVAPETAAPKVAVSRIKNAYQLAGVWYAADGSPLNDREAQQAHRAMDAAAAEARRKALLGGVE